MYDLRKAIHAVLDQGTIDPGVAADKVLSDMPPEAYQGALRTVLRSYIRSMISERRTTGDRSPEPELGSPASKGRSAKRRRVVAAWQRKLLEGVCIDESTSKWKALGTCTFDDLKAVAAMLHRKADQNSAMATKYERMANAVAASGVASLNDLPPEQLEELLS